MNDEVTDPGPLPADTTVGRVCLRVDSLSRVLPFYRDVIGCQIERAGSRAHLTTADGQELLVFEGVPGAPARPRTAAGLFHVAIRLPDRRGLADALARIRGSDAALTGASDHLVSEALYLRDPAGNGLELYRDRPSETWTRLEDGRVEMDTLRLDLDDLAAAGTGTGPRTLPEGTDVGHVHLEVTDLAAATDFYVDGLGFRRSSRDVRGASFLAAGDYHHHVGLNVWNRRTEPIGEHQGVRWFEIVLPEGASRDTVIDGLVDAGVEVTEEDDVPTVHGPDGIRCRIVVGGSPEDR